MSDRLTRLQSPKWSDGNERNRTMEIIERFWLLVKLAFSAMLAWFVSFPTVLDVLIIIIVLDIMTGFWCAWFRRELNSTKMFRGGLKKSAILVVIGLVYLVQHALNNTILLSAVPLAEMVCIYYILTESLSVLENLALMGVPVPLWLTRKLRIYYEEIEKNAQDG